jgi:CheY-like chemotaxis protein
MKKVLITDASKASVVMTSEVFKDYFPGVQILVARNAQESLDLVKEHKDIDLHVIDYHLHDIDGASHALKVKKLKKTPVIVTALHSDHIEQDIQTKLQDFPDCLNWVKKPIHPDLFMALAERYVKNQIRQEKRIECDLPMIGLFPKTAGRKTATEEESFSLYSGTLVNISLSGSCLVFANTHMSIFGSLEDLKPSKKPVKKTGYLYYPKNFLTSSRDFLSLIEDGFVKKVHTSKKSKATKNDKPTKEQKDLDVKTLCSGLEERGELKSIAFVEAWSKKEDNTVYMGVEFKDSKAAFSFYEEVVSVFSKSRNIFSKGFLKSI